MNSRNYVGRMEWTTQTMTYNHLSENKFKVIVARFWVSQKSQEDRGPYKLHLEYICFLVYKASLVITEYNKMLSCLNENIINSKQDLWLPRLEERGGRKRDGERLVTGETGRTQGDCVSAAKAGCLRVLTSWKGGRRVVSGREIWGCSLVCLQQEVGGYKPRNACVLQNLTNARKCILL